jgi:hypothetical protein
LEFVLKDDHVYIYFLISHFCWLANDTLYSAPCHLTVSGLMYCHQDFSGISVLVNNAGIERTPAGDSVENLGGKPARV